MLEKNFKIFLILSAIAGYLFPNIFSIPKSLVLILTTIILFVNYFSFNFKDITKVSTLVIAKFYISRFILLPYLISFLIFILDRDIVIALTLLSLMPAGVTSPAFTNIYKGNVSITILLVLITTLLTPITTFLVLSNVSGGVVELSKIFITLLISIFVPFLAHMPLRYHKRTRVLLKLHNNKISIILTIINMYVSVALCSNFIRDNFLSLFYFIIILCILFFIFYSIGWYLSKNRLLENRIAYCLSSGAQNSGLALAISLIYFSSEVSLMIILAAIPWTLALIPFGWFIDKKNKKVVFYGI